MAEHGDWADRTLAAWGGSRPVRMRLVMGDFPDECRCDVLGERKCRARPTAEDLLCDTCRGGNCCAMNIGGEWLDRHRQAPVITWEPAGVRDWGTPGRSVTWTSSLGSPNARIALGENADD